MTTERALAEPDSFDVFDAVCTAAELEPVDRLGVFRELPKDLQRRIWADAETHLNREANA